MIYNLWYLVNTLRREKRNEIDDDGQPYVDSFLLTHPDQDHCRGLRKHFHLGPLSEYNFSPPEGEELKIVMREIWSSPMIFRRASKNNPLCEDAKAFNTEARRRVKLFRDNRFSMEGDRILIIGKDEEGKTIQASSSSILWRPTGRMMPAFFYQVAMPGFISGRNYGTRKRTLLLIFNMIFY